MELIKKAIESIVKWVGIFGAVAILMITVIVWSFYDISDHHSRLTAQETIGLFLFSLLLVSVVKAIYIFAIKALKKESSDE